MVDRSYIYGVEALNLFLDSHLPLFSSSRGLGLNVLPECFTLLLRYRLLSIRDVMSILLYSFICTFRFQMLLAG